VQRYKIAVLLCLFMALSGGMLSAKDNLAVLPFTGGDRGEGETIAELFSFVPALNDVFVVIPRTSIARAVGNEQTFQQGTGMTDPDTIAAIGRQLGANYVVAGNIAKLGNRNLLIISILKIDELRQVAGDIQTYTQIEEIQDKLPDMARNIIAATQRDSSSLEKLAVVPVEMGGNIDSRVADILAQILSIYLIRSGRYSVYPRTETLGQVQEEYRTQLSGVTADENVVDIGRGDNPRIVLSVAARRLGAQNMFNASIINLESAAQIIGTSVNYNMLEDGIETMGNLARELTGFTGNFDIDTEPMIAGTTGGEAPGELTPVRRPSGAPAARPERAARAPGGRLFGYGVLNLALGLGSFMQKDWGGGLTVLGAYAAAGGLIAWELNIKYGNDLAGIPGGVGLGVAGVAALYGFIRPFIFNRNHPLANQANRVNLSIVPGDRGAAAVRLSYTLQF
jgi:TolB-like protein